MHKEYLYSKCETKAMADGRQEMVAVANDSHCVWLQEDYKWTSYRYKTKQLYCTKTNRNYATKKNVQNCIYANYMPIYNHKVFQAKS